MGPKEALQGDKASIKSESETQRPKAGGAGHLTGSCRECRQGIPSHRVRQAHKTPS